MNIELTNFKDNKQIEDIQDIQDMKNEQKDPLFDTSSNEDSQVNIDIDIDNESFIRRSNTEYLDSKNEVKNECKNEVKSPKKSIISTYRISKNKKLDELNKELEEVSDKSTIYEYHFEKLNKIYDVIGFINLLLDLAIILVGSISLTETLAFEPEIIVIIFGFVNGIVTGISKLFKYKDKIAYIGKYISDLDHLKDTIKIQLIQIESQNISDQDYLKELEKINLTITNSNSSIFNIDSREYYNYYNRMKGIKEKKRIINHEICLEKERKYNDFSKRHLNYLSERLKMKNKLKDIHEQVKMNNIPDFYESDVFTITNLTTNEE